MSNQITKVDLIPNGELSVCNVSQFDNGRVLPFEILENKEAYNIPNDIRVELHCRKPDGNIVTLPSENISDNIVTFLSTTQLTACYGKNVCEIALYGPDDYLIGSCNFILDVERDPLLGGINSMTAIHNLEEQIEEITTEIVGENYYNKSEVDNKLSLKANAADVYTKSQTDSLLSSKADSSSVYTKSQTDILLNAKADVSDLPDMTDYYTKTATDALLDEKADQSDTYTKEQVDALIDNIFPILTASGPIATFTTALTKLLVSVTAAAGATEITACGVNLINVPDAVVINTGITYDTLVTTINVIAGVTYTLSCMQENSMTSNERNTLIIVINGVRTYENSTSNYHLSSGIHSLTFTPSVSGACEIRIWGHTLSTQTTYDKFQLEVGSTVTTYKSYNGQTVPVSDATTLVTQSGVNNVYANIGDVTVQYKYMSM